MAKTLDLLAEPDQDRERPIASDAAMSQPSQGETRLLPALAQKGLSARAASG